MRRVDRHTRRGLLLAAVVSVPLLAAAYVGVSTIASGRHAAMQAAAGAAREAVRAARAEDAKTWAPDELRAAERAAGEALTLQRIEEVRVWPIPSADPVVTAWASTERAARAAITAAHDRRAAAADSASAQIEEARVAVSASESLAVSIHLGPERRVLAQAKQALDQARAYQQAGALQAARERARQALALASDVRQHAAGLAERYAEPENVARWRRWKDETIAWSRREGLAAIVVVKDTHQMTLYVRGEAVRSYPVELGFNWIADKFQEGDGATPEGRYRVVKRMDHLASDYYKALLIDYPNGEDRAEFSLARRRGDLLASARIGGLIEIHGGGGRGHDWTNGCVAVTNQEIDDLYPRVTVGTPVTIVGSDTYGPIAEFAKRYQRDASRRRP